MLRTSSDTARMSEATESHLTSIEKKRIKHEALHVAATRGGLITFHGKEVQAKSSLEDARPSFAAEGLLRQVSEGVTRQAQLTYYRDQGLTRSEIIKTIWH